MLNLNKADGQTAKYTLEGDDRVPLFGKKIGDEVSGDDLHADLTGYSFKITGGSDEDGFPMRGDFDSVERKKILFKARTVGYKPKKGEKGMRRRKMVRGAEIQDDISQLNLKVLKEGNPLE